MKYIALSIVLFMVGYTFVMLRYRKLNRSYEPYHDFKARFVTVHLLRAGYQRITLPSTRAGDAPPIPAGATIEEAPPGIPPALQQILVDHPHLPAEYRNVATSNRLEREAPCSVAYTYSVAVPEPHPGNVRLYVKDHRILIVPEPPSGDLASTGRSYDFRTGFTIPAGALKTGRYEVVLVGSRRSRTWTWDVR